MNGKTVVSNLAPPALPQAATAAPVRSVRSTYGSVAAPTASTAPAHRSDSSGFPSPVTSSRVRIPAAPIAGSRVRLVGLAGRRPDLVAAVGQDRQCRAAHAAGRTGHQHRPVGRVEAALLERDDGHRRREPGRPDRHRVARRQARRQRHDPAGRHALVLRVAAVARDAQLVSVGEDRRPDLDGGSELATTSPGQVDARDERTDPRDLAVRPRRKPVLVVDARPADADLDLAIREVRSRELADAALDRLPDLLGDVGAERGGDRGHADILGGAGGSVSVAVVEPDRSPDIACDARY